MNETAVSSNFLEFHTWIRSLGRRKRNNICDCGEAVSYADVSLCDRVAYPPPPPRPPPTRHPFSQWPMETTL